MSGSKRGPETDRAGVNPGGDADLDLIRAQVTGDWPVDDPRILSLLDVIRKRHGDALDAVLVYGSYLRGKRDTLLDFYILLRDFTTLPSRWQGPACRLLPPNVYQIHVGTGADASRAKCATLLLSQFESALAKDFHSYFWARFAQPSRVLYCRDAAVRERLTLAIGDAARSFVRRVVPMLPDRFSGADLWVRGLGLTYRCELRTEDPAYARGLFEANQAYLKALTAALADGELGYRAVGGDDDAYRSELTPSLRRRTARGWWIRRMQGKLLSGARIIKAALTFEDPLDYLLWKIERHSGVHVEPSPRQRRYPLIFAWGLLWQLYRKGAFR
ncbi:MAG: hypothetical protein PVG91_04430 [Gammaproteobacteria bacterium]|jgi:hypothetical protein